METVAIGFASLAGIGVGVYAGVHVAIALSGVSLLAMWAITGNLDLAVSFVALAAVDSIADDAFGVIPLFVLMGFAVSESGFGRDTFAVVSRALSGMRGGLGMATVVSNAIFAAVTGISIASAAVFAKVAVPEMVRAGYDRSLAVGVVAGSAVLGMLIPPSLLLILFAVLTDSSVGDLFLGGIGPGLLLTGAYCAYLAALGRRRPGLVGRGRQDAAVPPVPRRLLLPVLVLAAVVLGGIYAGFFTPTEAGAVGAFLALAAALAMRRLDPRALWRIAVQTGHVTAAICFLIIGASIYGRMLALSGVPATLTEGAAALGLGPVGFLLLFSLLLIALGTVLDAGSTLLVTVPLAFPVAQQLGVDLVHFGLIAVIAAEVGLLTPPLGLSVYVVQSTLKDTGVGLGEVFRGAAPFAAVMTLVLVLVILFPQIVLAILGR